MTGLRVGRAQHQCQIKRKTGWFKTETCGQLAEFRCPICKIWICEQHQFMAFTEAIPMYYQVMEGFLCSAECQQRLIADIQQNSRDQSSLLREIYWEAHQLGLSPPQRPPVKDFAKTGLFITDIRFAKGEKEFLDQFR